MVDTLVLILAAGLGKRMRVELPKAAVTTSEMPLIAHVISTVSQIQPKKTVVVTGHKKELLESAAIDAAKKFALAPLTFAFQSEQRGTGHAVKSALHELKGFKGAVLILYGDVPLITAETLQQLVSTHEQEKATVSLISFIADNPGGYGRIIRNRETHDIERIIESKDCTAKEALIKEVNSGIYVVDSAFLAPAVEALENKNVQSEYYLTDIIEKAVKEGQRVSSVTLHEQHEVRGVNTPYELASVNETLRTRRIKSFVNSGVVIDDIHSVFIDSTVIIEAGVRIGPGVQLLGKTVVQTGVRIEGSAYLLDTTIGKDSRIKIGVRTEGVIIGNNCSVGPFANLRPETVLADEVKIGNFVETKKAMLAKNVSASHLTYLGDCSVGEGSNIGAGTITCNYDGANKHFTKIEENVFVGSNTALVAPITIGKGATIGAGSVITKNIEPTALALTRSELKVRKDYQRPRKKL